MQVAANSDVIFIAVKPQYVSLVLKEAKPHLKSDTIIVSIISDCTALPDKFVSRCALLVLSSRTNTAAIHTRYLSDVPLVVSQRHLLLLFARCKLMPD